MKFFVILIVLVFLLVPMSSAQALDPLVVCGREGKPPCTPCMIFEQIKRILDFITITLVPIVAVIMFLVGGVMMIFAGASPEMLTKGRSMLTLTVIGVVIVYGAYLVTNTVIQLLAGDDDRAKSWFVFDCTGGDVPLPSNIIGPLPTPTTGGRTGGTGGNGGGTRTWNPPPVIPGVSLSDADARQYLKTRSNNQIETDAFTNCATNSQVECGSFEGVKISTLDEMLRVQRDCNCAISINDATGDDHKGAAHPAGTAFDLQHSSTVDAKIRQYPKAPGYTDGQHFLGPNGAVYWNEDSGHWHVEVH